MLAFAAFRRFDDLTERRAACAALGLGAILSAWGLAQVGFLGVARASALFETPATYAAVINLLLVPALALLLCGVRRVPLLGLGALLAAALFAADSRGGLLGLAAGLGAAAILALRAKALHRRGMLLVLGVLAAGWILAAGLRALPHGAPGASGPETPPTSEARAASSVSRLELYDLSWRAWLERPLAGTGYLTFRYVLEQGRSRVPSYGDSGETWFAHNDYLQTLQELGLLGLAALIALAWLPALLAYRRVPGMPLERRPVALASASALTAMACHALVDFPFYIPACLVLCGALLGILDRRLGEGREPTARTAATPSWYRAARAALAVLATVLLVRPLAAEAAGDWGLRRSAAGQSQSAAFWLEAARRLDGSDWRYHWYAGQFWDGQAADSGRRDAARFAAEAFAAGVEANPLEVKNLLGKISVHRRHRKLLAAPADCRHAGGVDGAGGSARAPQQCRAPRARPAWSSEVNRRSVRGYSLAELVIVIVIAAIMAALAIPLFNQPQIDATWYHEQVRAGVRYAQRTAVAQRRQVFVLVEAGPRLALCYADPCGARVTELATGNDFRAECALGRGAQHLGQSVVLQRPRPAEQRRDGQRRRQARHRQRGNGLCPVAASAACPCWRW